MNTQKSTKKVLRVNKKPFDEVLLKLYNARLI